MFIKVGEYWGKIHEDKLQGGCVIYRTSIEEEPWVTTQYFWIVSPSFLKKLSQKNKNVILFYILLYEHYHYWS